MSAPRTNIDRQKSRHRPVLIALVLVTGLALALFFGLTVWLADQGQTPGDPAPVTVAPAEG